jgi:hypothetical protein
MEKINEQAANARSSGGDRRWWYFKQDHTTYFYLLPPWSSSGDLSRKVWKHRFPKGYEPGVLTCMQTFHKTHPGSSCPVCEALESCAKFNDGNDKFSSMTANRPRIYVNALPVGTKGIAASDVFQEFGGDDAGKPHILEMPVSVYSAICQKMAEPGVGSICMPTAATMIWVTRTGKGFQTRYKVEFQGTNSPTGFTPQRDNICPTPEQMKVLEDGIFNLDEAWLNPITKPEEMAKFHKHANAIRARFATPGGMTVAPTPGHAVMMASGYGLPGMPTPPPVPNYPQQPQAPITQSAPPPLPQSVPVAPPLSKPVPQPPVAAVTTPSIPTPTVTAPSIPNPTVATTPAQATTSPAMASVAAAIAATPEPSSYTVEQICSEDLKLDSVPMVGSTPNRPVCMSHTSAVKAGPNAAICEKCVFQVPCGIAEKAKAGGA